MNAQETADGADPSRLHATALLITGRDVQNQRILTSIFQLARYARTDGKLSWLLLDAGNNTNGGR